MKISNNLYFDIQARNATEFILCQIKVRCKKGRDDVGCVFSAGTKKAPPRKKSFLRGANTELLQQFFEFLLVYINGDLAALRANRRFRINGFTGQALFADHVSVAAGKLEASTISSPQRMHFLISATSCLSFL